MSTRTQRGFTLMELLVVIAIIGILASVVLASLNTARDKGRDAAIKSNLNNTRAQAEIVYDNSNGSYATVCDDTNVARAVSASSGSCFDGAAGWAADANLNGAGRYCVDYTGNATTTSSDTTSIGSADFDCN